MTRLVLENARVAFGDTVRLGPINLDFVPVGLTTILGPNGAGKSLFLALCHGTLPPSTGEVLWDDAPAKMSRHSRGYMLQTPVVLRRTVAANIDFALRSNGTAAHERAAKVKNALAVARLTDRGNASAATLSGGELRRMNLARALVTEPSVLLLDEPFAGLDPSAIQAMETIIVETAKTTPVLMSNHHLVQTRRISDRILFISGGQLTENTQASDFFALPNSPQAVNFLKGQML